MWSVACRARRMAYQNVHQPIVRPERDRSLVAAGAGVGYRFGDTLRLGFDANYYRRAVDQTHRVR